MVQIVATCQGAREHAASGASCYVSGAHLEVLTCVPKPHPGQAMTWLVEHVDQGST